MIFIATCIRNEKPSEVWLIVLSYLLLNDVIETSSVCKWFFGLSRKISFFNKNLEHSRLFFNNSRVILTVMRFHAYHFMDISVFVLKNMSGMKIIS